ncbi:MAG: BatA and WFA domain-containing protein [Pirellulaceae bacterium]
MDFINGWSIGIGIAALAAPIAVHFLTKPKPIAYSLSTIHFLQEVIEQRRARSRFRDLLIMLLRTLCIALLAAAIARPMLSARPAVPIAAEQDSLRVIVLDVSQSMSAGSGGVSSWSTAVASALQYLDQGSGVRAAVIFAGARSNSVFDSLSPNLAALREAVKQAVPRAERADSRSALELAATLLDQEESGRKELVIISDFQRSNWGTLLLDLIPSDTQVQFHSVAPHETGNLAVTAVRFSMEPVIGQATVMEIELSNHMEREANVRCSIDLGVMNRTFEAKLMPQSTQTFSESIVFHEIGWKHGWVRLENNLDVLPEDDERPVAIRVRPPVKVLLVSRQNSKEVPSSSFYLQQALDIAMTVGEAELRSDAEQLASSVVRVHPGRDALHDWPPCDVYVLDHPGSLSAETCKFLAAQLRRGKGVLYVTTELVDAVNLKELEEILGADFQPPVNMVAETGGHPRQDLFVRQVRGREAPFQILGSANVTSLLRSVRFHGGLNTTATQEGLKDQVKAELSDRSALLYCTVVGAGQMAVLNADLGKSNWAVEPTFLPVMSELIQSLLASRSFRDPNSSGEPLVRILPATANDVSKLAGETIVGPAPSNGDFGQWNWVASQNSVVWNWQEPPGPGIYSLGQDGAPVWMVATSIPSIESELSSLNREVLTGRMSGGRAVGYTSTESDAEQDDTLWNWLIVACLCGLFAEIGAAVESNVRTLLCGRLNRKFQ